MVVRGDGGDGVLYRDFCGIASVRLNNERAAIFNLNITLVGIKRFLFFFFFILRTKLNRLTE